MPNTRADGRDIDSSRVARGFFPEEDLPEVIANGDMFRNLLDRRRQSPPTPTGAI